MDLVTWDTSYSVSVKSCDAEHQTLFALINEMHQAMKVGKGRTILPGIVHKLETYAQTHFAQEEALMARAQYPELISHQEQHRQFISRVKNFKKEIESDGGGDSVATLTFVRDWLTNHIQQTDKQYSKHLNSRGIN